MKNKKNVKKKYYQDMDKIRLLACISVLLYHFNILKGGYLAVCTFFVLSGYLSCISAFNKEKFSFWEYYKNRFLKLYLPLIIVTFSVIAITHLVPSLSWLNLKPETRSVFLVYNNFWQLSANLDYFARHVSSPFMHLWYIAILLQFDLVFPFIYLLLRKIGDKVNKLIPCIVPSVLGIISFLFFYNMSLTGNMMIPYYNTFTRAYSLLFGLSFGFIQGYYGVRISTAPKKKAYNKKMFYIYFGLLIILFILVDAKSVFFAPAMFVTSIISMRIIDYSMANVHKELTKKDKIIKSLSSISYEIYLVQYPVIYLFEHININILAKVPCMIAIILILSYILHYSFDFKKKEKDKKKKMSKIKKIPKIILCFAFIIFAAFGIYGFYVAVDHTIEMKKLEEELAENEKLIEKSKEEYVKRMEEENASWQEKLDGLDDPEAIKEAISNFSVVGVGDSVMLGAVENLSAAFPNGYFDAKVSRSIWVTNEILVDLKNKNMLGEPVVLNLGANGDCSESCKKEILNTIGEKEVFWVNVTNNDNVHVNEKLDALASEYENLHVIDWATISKGHDEYFYADGIHLTIDGRVAYTDAIYNAIYEVYVSKLDEERQKIIDKWEEELRNKIAFYGNDILLYAFDNLQENFGDAVFNINKDYKFKSLKEELEKAVNDNTLNNKIVFAFDDTMSLSLANYEELIKLCEGKEIYIVSTNKKSDSVLSKINYDNVTVIDFYKETEAHSEYLMKDKVHLTAEGNIALAEMLNIFNEYESVTPEE